VDAIRALADFVAPLHIEGRQGHRDRTGGSHASQRGNALLKMLEEPPGGATYFVLVSHRPDRVLTTIRSRCFRVPFGVPAADAALDC